MRHTVSDRGERGHLIGMTHEACLEPPPPGLLAGIEEFNRGEFFECHETLEELWMAEPR